MLNATHCHSPCSQAHDWFEVNPLHTRKLQKKTINAPRRGKQKRSNSKAPHKPRTQQFMKFVHNSFHFQCGARQAMNCNMRPRRYTALRLRTMQYLLFQSHTAQQSMRINWRIHSEWRLKPYKRIIITNLLKWKKTLNFNYIFFLLNCQVNSLAD